MVEIKAADVKRLRDATSAPMMACKTALVDAEGDFEKAADLVRERTGAKMAARAGERIANEGIVHAYLHTPSPGSPAKAGVLLQLACETDFVAKTEAFVSLANDICLHITAFKPRFVSEADVDEATIAKEQDFVRKEAIDQGKPENIIERIVEGKVAAMFKEQVLLNQPFIKDDSITVGKMIEGIQGTLGEKIEVISFTRYQIGA